MKQMTKGNEVYNAVNEVLDSLYSYDKVAVRIYGKLYHFTERQVRALQVVALNKAKESDKAFEEFTQNVIVYSQNKVKGSYEMIFNKYGRFDNKFPCGFYDTCALCNLETLRAERNGK